MWRHANKLPAVCKLANVKCELQIDVGIFSFGINKNKADIKYEALSLRMGCTEESQHKHTLCTLIVPFLFLPHCQS